MPKSKAEPWHPKNGWGIQIYTRGPKGFYWRHATDRAQWHTEAMAKCFADGLKAAEFDRPYRLVDPKGEKVKKWGPPVEEDSDA